MLNLHPHDPADQILEVIRRIPGQLETIKSQTTSSSKIVLLGWLIKGVKAVHDKIPDGSKGAFDVAARELNAASNNAKAFGSGYIQAKIIRHNIGALRIRIGFLMFYYYYFFFFGGGGGVIIAIIQGP